MGRKWVKNGSKMGQKWVKNGSKNVANYGWLWPNLVYVILVIYQGEPFKWVKKWSKNGSKMGQKWVKNGSKSG